MKHKGLAVVILAAVTAVVLLFLFVWMPGRGDDDTKQTKKEGKTAVLSGSFDKTLHSTTAADSIWVIANKPQGLNPKDYAPSDLVMPKVPLRVPGNESMQMRGEAAAALEQLVAAAKAEGLDLMLASGYRSYSYQVNLYGGYVSSVGQAAADTTSARPGHSEHQTGLAVDIEPSTRDCELEACFGTLPEGKWLAANAHKFGYIIRYPDGKAGITGYEYEPWHIRYVGAELAAELHSSGKTMEEFFGVRGGKDY